MKKQILTISVVIIITFMLLATMPPASSNANEDDKVWSDGYVELTLSKIYRTDTVPPELRRPPEVRHDFVVMLLISRLFVLKADVSCLTLMNGGVVFLILLCLMLKVINIKLPS